MLQTKQDKIPEADLKETEISDLPGKEFKIMVIKMLTKVSRKMDKGRISAKREKNIRKYSTEIIELNNTITELKNLK